MVLVEQKCFQVRGQPDARVSVRQSQIKHNTRKTIFHNYAKNSLTFAPVCCRINSHCPNVATIYRHEHHSYARNRTAEIRLFALPLCCARQAV